MEKKRLRRLSAAVMAVIALCVLLAGTAFAKDARKLERSLFRYAPADAVAAGEISNISKTYDDILASDFYRNITETDMYTQWTSTADYRKMINDKANFQTQQGFTIEEMLLDIFGEEVVVVVTAAPGGTPKEGSGVLLTKAVNESTLRSHIDLLNQMEEGDGKLVSLTEEDYDGITIYEKVKLAKPPKGKAASGEELVEKTEYYSIAGDVFLTGNDKSIIKKILDLHTGKTKESLINVPEFRQAYAGLPEDSRAFMYVDIKKLRDRIPSLDDIGYKNPGAKFLIAGLIENLKATREVVVSVSAQNDLTIESLRRYDAAALDPYLQKAILSRKGPVKAIDYAPEDTVIFWSSKIDFENTWKYLQKNMNETQRMKADNLVLILNQLAHDPTVQSDSQGNALWRFGPEVSIIIATAPQGGAKIAGAIFVDVDQNDASRYQSVLNTLLTLQSNPVNGTQPQIKFTTETYKDHTLNVITPLKGDMVNKLTPTYCLKDSTFMLATSKEFLVRCIDARGKPSTAFDSASVSELKSINNDRKTVILVNARNLGRLAQDNRQQLINDAVKKGKEPDTARKELDDLLEIIGLFDQAKLTTGVDASSAQRKVYIKTR